MESKVKVDWKKRKHKILSFKKHIHTIQRTLMLIFCMFLNNRFYFLCFKVHNFVFFTFNIYFFGLLLYAYTLVTASKNNRVQIFQLLHYSMQSKRMSNFKLLVSLRKTTSIFSFRICTIVVLLTTCVITS